ncbi:hypothetical protein [Thermosyntropha sp.]|nr:hypothetical protein [Thermosyntropha sp.]
MVNFQEMQKLYELVKQGVIQKATGEGFKIYDLKNGIIRIDIKKM